MSTDKENVNFILGFATCLMILAMVFFSIFGPMINSLNKQCDMKYGALNWGSKVVDGHWICYPKEYPTTCAPFECNETITLKGY